jgi:hypothetical protein
MTEPRIPDSIKQESTIEVEGRLLVVQSDLILVPEALMVTLVLDGERVVHKRHVALPATLAKDIERTGPSVALPTLRMQHLRFLRNLVTSEKFDLPKDRAGMKPGTLATLVIAADGEIINRDGEEQVPGDWVRSGYLLGGLIADLGAALSLGEWMRGTVRGDGIAAVVGRDGTHTRVTFVDSTMTVDLASIGLFPREGSGG